MKTGMMKVGTIIRNHWAGDNNPNRNVFEIVGYSSGFDVLKDDIKSLLEDEQ